MKKTANPASGGIRIISFDLDGTLIDKNFDDAIWLEELPLLFAEQYGMSVAAAKRIFYSEYAKVGPNRMDWYDIEHWFAKMKLKVTPRKVVEGLRHKIRIYPDSIPALKTLRKTGVRMVVLTNSPRVFTEIKIKTEGLEGFFEKIVCVPTDYKRIKSHGNVFARLARECKVRKSEILHVGDSYEQDYIPAIKEGCGAVLLERAEIPAKDRINDSSVEKISTLKALCRKVAR